ncbi:MAG: T9SS type A sorting domain-containing protein [Bacteroidetes bacterium]|nr:T9SS type A sorting domain-containing protein [Bacteroidota bacterium]
MMLASCFACAVHAQVVNARQFLALEQGNTWEYRDGATGEWSFTITIIGDTVNAAGDTLVAYTQRDAGTASLSHGWYWVDSLNQVYSSVDPDAIRQNLSYKLDAKLGDKWRVRHDDTITWAQVIDRSPTSVFGTPTETMKVEYYYATNESEQWEYVVTLAGGFGMVMYESHPSSVDYLSGAIINGVRYGTLADVAVERAEPVALRIYPNPSSGISTISYTLPTAGFVRTIAYDALGHVMAYLTEEPQEAGEHHVMLDGSGLSSGICFIRLSFNGTTRTLPLRIER